MSKIIDKEYDVITILDICIDILLQGGDLVPEFGQKEKKIWDYNIEIGGSSVIFACQAANLNLNIAGIGVIGNDIFGNFVLKRLIEVGVDTSYIKKDKQIKTGVGIALCKKNDRAILTYPGTIEAVSGKEIDNQFLKKSRHLHISSYYLMPQLYLEYKEIIKKARDLDVTISLDTNWDPEEKWDNGLEEILSAIDVFLPNENEIMAITNKNNIKDAVKSLDTKIPIIVVKKGKNGATVYKHGNSYSISSLDVNVIDTVGAGDNFNAGFIYGFLNGYSTNK